MQADLAAFKDLPAAPYDACHKVATRVSSLSLVRYRNNDYIRFRRAMDIKRSWRKGMSTGSRSPAAAKRSPPTSAATTRRTLFTIRCIIWLCWNTRARRSIRRRRSNGWALAECIHRLRRLMEARMGNPGRREFIQVLRLMEDFHQHQVEQAVTEALRLGAISFDAVKMLLLARLENRPVRLDLTFYPYLPAATVGATDRAPISDVSPTPLPDWRAREFPHDDAAVSDLANYRRAASAAGQSSQGVEASPPLRASTRRWRWTRRAIAPTTRAICFVCANWSASTANGATSSAGFAGPLFSGQEPRHFRLRRPAVAQQIAGAGVGAREWIEKRQNCIALGPSGTGKTHAALALGLAACQKGHSVAFTTAAALVHELMEARDERRLRALQKHLNTVKLLIVDELGYVPFTAVGSELLFEVFSQRYDAAPPW